VVLRGDIRDPASAREALGDREFDAVVDWVAFTPEHVRADIELFRGRTGQYVFISSASAYQTPPSRLPVTESTPLRNPFWQYSRDKIACEDLLVTAYREEGFPGTIVRPSHTYDRTRIPLEGKWTAIARMRAGREVVVHGDGTSLWTLTHHDDFARGFVPLLGHSRTIGEAFHITSDDVLTWNQIAEILGAAAGAQARIVHVPSDAIAAADADWGAGLLGDKAHSMVFDNSKLRAVVPGYRAEIPFEAGAREIMEWFDEDPSRQQVDERLDALMDKLIETYRPTGSYRLRLMGPRSAADDLSPGPGGPPSPGAAPRGGEPRLGAACLVGEPRLGAACLVGQPRILTGREVAFERHVGPGLVAALVTVLAGRPRLPGPRPVGEVPELGVRDDLKRRLEVPAGLLERSDPDGHVIGKVGQGLAELPHGPGADLMPEHFHRQPSPLTTVSGQPPADLPRSCS
jgi:nucleoside-diphosphate-sugar epimerase